jgi:NDP-sugar pyrophosphorylase family protein
VIGSHTVVEEGAVVSSAIIWPDCRISRDSVVEGAILGRHCHIGRNVTIEGGVILGDKSAVTDFSRLTPAL